MTIRGTAKELTERGLKVNGVFVDAVGLGQLLKYKLISEAGKAEKDPSKRGRAALIYELTETETLKVTTTC